MIIFILILGTGLRLIALNQSFWLDEATSALTTRMSLFDFFQKFAPGDFHPPLYYLTLRVWSIMFGSSELALRSLSVIFGIGTIYVVFLIGKELINKKTGIVAGLLLATSGLHIYYSQEARMYAMSAFLVTLAVYFFTRIIRGYSEPKKTFHKSREGYWVLFSITIGLIFLTDYLPLLILPVFWFFGIFTKQKLSWFKKLFMSHIILGIFVMSWFLTFIRQLTSGVNVVSSSPSWVNVLGKFSLKEIFLIPVKFVIGRVGFDNKFIYALVVGISFLVFGYLLMRTRKELSKLRLVWLWLTIPLGVALLISLKLPILNYFRFLFVLPALYLILATGIINLGKGALVKIMVILVIGINLITSFIYLTNKRYQREDWRSFTNFIGNEPVIYPANSQKEAFLYYNPNANIVDINNISSLNTVWLMRYAAAISDPNDQTRVRLEKLGYKKAGEFDFNGVVVWKYNKFTYANKQSLFYENRN